MTIPAPQPVKMGCWQRALTAGLVGFVLLCIIIGIASQWPSSSAPAASVPTDAPVAIKADPPTVIVEPTTAPEPTSAAPTIESIREQQTLTAQIGRRLFLARDYGDDWPFTVEEVEVSCLPGRLVVMDAGGTRYALNGTAQRDYPRFDPVWVTETTATGLRKSVQPFLDEGLELCE